MSKTVSLFVFSGIVSAALGAATASGGFVQSIVESRLPLKGSPTEKQIDACLSAMAEAWRDAGLESASLKVYSSCAKTLLSIPMPMLLGACELGTGRNGVMLRVNAMLKAAAPAAPASVKKAGRPAGKGAGKSTAVKAGSGGDPINPMAEAGVITRHVVQAREAMATCLKWQENGRGLSTAQVDEIKEHYAAIAAVLGSLIAKAK